MGQRGLATPKSDDAKKRPQNNKKRPTTAVMKNTKTRKGEALLRQAASFGDGDAASFATFGRFSGEQIDL